MQNMNSVIILILITFEACINTKYLLVEIPDGQTLDVNSKESQRNQFRDHAINEPSSPEIRSS